MEKINNTINNGVNNKSTDVDSEIKALISGDGAHPIVSDDKKPVNGSYAAYSDIHVMPHKAFDNVANNLRRISLTIVSLSVVVVAFISLFALASFVGNKTQKALPVVITPIVDYEIKSNVDIDFNEEVQEPVQKIDDATDAMFDSDALKESVIFGEESVLRDEGKEYQEVKIGDLIPLKEVDQVVQNDGGQNASSPSREKLLAMDTDNDGLFDLEEVIFGLNRDSTDTDENSVNDYDELIELFTHVKNNPSDGGLLSVYQNKAYSLIHPVEWVYAGDENGLVSWKAGSDHNVQVLVVNTTNDYSDITSWYANEVSARKIDDGQIIKGENWRGIISDNGLVAYIMGDSDAVFIVSYMPFADDEAVYSNLFKMMVNYFVIK